MGRTAGEGVRGLIGIGWTDIVSARGVSRDAPCDALVGVATAVNGGWACGRTGGMGSVGTWLVETASCSVDAPASGRRRDLASFS